MEINRENIYIIIREDDNIIEKYSLTEEINFKGLVDYLLKKNLSNKVHIESKVKDLTESEENLISLINKIIVSYNDKVEELVEFKKSYEIES